jgi:DNA-binding CsgD family transcriptional regulator
MRRNYKGKIKYVATKLEREKLKKELLNQKIKVSEVEVKWLVADNKMRLTYLKEFYEALQSDFKLEKTQGIKSYIKGLLLKVQMQMTTEEKLSKIQSKVETLNRYFENKLIEKYPTLTKSEREVCGLLRINLSIKEVASIRNSTIDSVKSIRYRLRKKFKLDKSIELEKFIQTL